MSYTVKLNQAEVEEKNLNMKEIETALRELAQEVKTAAHYGSSQLSRGKVAFRVAQMTGVQANAILAMADTIAAMVLLIQKSAARLEDADRLISDTTATV